MLQRWKLLLWGLNALKKTFLKGIFLVILSSLFFTHIPVFATSTNSPQPTEIKSQAETENEVISETMATLGFLSQWAYLLLWPLVALAWIAMDNNLVYGSYLNLDAPLWKVWTIVKNLSNFVLGFIFLYEILYYVIDPDRKMSKIKSPWELLKKTLLAGVLVQLSWFIMMVAVDISSVLTYTVGALPTTLLSQTDAKMDTKIVGVSVWSNLWNIEGKGTQEDKALSYYVTLSWNQNNIAPCKLESVKIKGKEQMVIVGREFYSLGNWKNIERMLPGYCFYNGTIYSYNERNNEQNAEDRTKTQKLKLSSFKEIRGDEILTQMSWAYQILPLTAVFSQQSVSNAGCSWYVGPIPNTPILWNKEVWTSSSSSKKEYYCLYEKGGFSLSELTQRATGWTGPFMALYGNMISFAHINESLSLKQQFISLTLNTVFLVMLFLPLVMIVAVLFWRIFQLWMAIALSPLIVLVNVFWDILWGLKTKFLDDIFDLEKLKGLLLAPVFIGFALSMSLMFMTILKTSIHPGQSDAEKLAAKQGITSLTGMKCGEEQDKNTCDLMGFIKITFSSAVIDLYSLLIGLFGIAISWILLFWAIKQTSFGKEWGEKIQKLGEDYLKTMPIIPVNWSKVGLSAIANTPNEILNKQIGKFAEQRKDDEKFLLGDKDTVRKRYAEQNLKYGNMDYYKKYLDKEFLADKKKAEEAKENLKVLYAIANKDFAAKIPEINTKILVPYLKNSEMKRESIQTTFNEFNVEKNSWDAIMSAVGGPVEQEYQTRKKAEQYLKYGNMDYYEKYLDKEFLADKKKAEEAKENLKVLYAIANKDFAAKIPEINTKILVPYLKNSEMKRESIQTTFNEFNIEKDSWGTIMSAVGGPVEQAYKTRKKQEEKKNQNS